MISQQASTRASTREDKHEKHFMEMDFRRQNLMILTNTLGEKIFIFIFS